MGRYRPPDDDDRPPAKRPKPDSRPPTVRFEMPFAIWCDTCPRPTIIGQGVRFNAMKRREGSYYSTPIWGFTFRHAECGGEIKMRTDPKNTAYVVVRGARERETGEEVVTEGDAVVMGGEEREALRQNAFAGLEKTIEDRGKAEGAVERLGELEDVSTRQWDNPYKKNQVLRRTFREERKRLEKEGKAAEELKDKMGLGIELLPAAETDGLRASLVDFGTSGDVEGTDKALAKPMFAPSTKGATKGGTNGKTAPTRSRSFSSKETKGKLKSEILASKRKESLVSEILGNTRLVQDPFLDAGRTAGSPGPTRFAGVRRKPDAGGGEPSPVEEVVGRTKPASGLVNYDSE